jgi:hypothetical protein
MVKLPEGKREVEVICVSNKEYQRRFSVGKKYVIKARVRENGKIYYPTIVDDGGYTWWDNLTLNFLSRNSENLNFKFIKFANEFEIEE